MNKIYSFLCSSLLVVSTWAIAEEAELLDAYLEGLPSSSTNQNADSSTFIGQPVEIVVDENGQRHEVIQTQTIEYRRVETTDGSELYEEVVTDQPAVVTNEARTNSDVMVNNQIPAQTEDGLEVIQLEPEESDFVVIEAPENQTVADTVSTSNAVSGHVYCQQNPYVRECLLSKYLSLCKQNPQSTDCKSQLQKFDGFCETFPNAYKCKKAKIAASCKQNPQSSECKSFTQRYCQKYPKAIFCNYN